MGLKEDLIIAKIKGVQEVNPKFKYDGQIKKVFETQSEYETRAILNFLTNPNLHFTIKELKASVEVEKIETPAPYTADIAMTRTMKMISHNLKFVQTLTGLIVAPLQWAADIEILDQKPLKGLNAFIAPINGFFDRILAEIAAMLPKEEGKGEVVIPPVDFKKDGGQGGAMVAVGHAYIGIKDPVPDSDTQVTAENNDFTKVVLVESNIPPGIVDDVTTGNEKISDIVISNEDGVVT